MCQFSGATFQLQCVVTVRITLQVKWGSKHVVYLWLLVLWGLGELPRQIRCRQEYRDLATMTARPTTSAAMKTPMMAPVKAEGAVETKQKSGGGLRSSGEGGTAGLSAFRRRSRHLFVFYLRSHGHMWKELNVQIDESSSLLTQHVFIQLHKVSHKGMFLWPVTHFSRWGRPPAPGRPAGSRCGRRTRPRPAWWGCEWSAWRRGRPRSGRTWTRGRWRPAGAPSSTWCWPGGWRRPRCRSEWRWSPPGPWQGARL